MKFNEATAKRIKVYRDKRLSYDQIAEAFGITVDECRFQMKILRDRLRSREFCAERKKAPRRCDLGLSHYSRPITDAAADAFRRSIKETRDLTGIFCGDPLPHQQRWRTGS